MNFSMEKHRCLKAYKQHKIPLADPTKVAPLSKAEAATFFVVSTVVLLVLAILSSMYETNNGILNYN